MNSDDVLNAFSGDGLGQGGSGDGRVRVDLWPASDGLE